MANQDQEQTGHIDVLGNHKTSLSITNQSLKAQTGNIIVVGSCWAVLWAVLAVCCSPDVKPRSRQAKQTCCRMTQLRSFLASCWDLSCSGSLCRSSRDPEISSRQEAVAGGGCRCVAFVMRQANHAASAAPNPTIQGGQGGQELDQAEHSAGCSTAVQAGKLACKH